MFFIASFSMANRFADVRGVAPTTRVFVDDARRKVLGDLVFEPEDVAQSGIQVQRMVFLLSASENEVMLFLHIAINYSPPIDPMLSGKSRYIEQVVIANSNCIIAISKKVIRWT